MRSKDRRSLHELSAEVATNPQSTAFVELAAAYRERGDVERALRLCLRGIQRHPTHVEAHFELGRIYEARGDRELALDQWGIVRQLAPEHLPTRLALVRLYLAEGRADDAHVELESARRLAPSNGALAQLAERVKAACGEPETPVQPATAGQQESEDRPEPPGQPERAGQQESEDRPEPQDRPETRDRPVNDDGAALDQRAAEGQGLAEAGGRDEREHEDEPRTENEEVDAPRRSPVDPLAVLKKQYPGVLGLLVADSSGRLIAGRMTGRGGDSDSMLANTLVGARSEAARVARYLDLGELRSIAVESRVARLNLAPLGADLVIVATSGDVPSGQVVLIMQRACELAAAIRGRGDG